MTDPMQILYTYAQENMVGMLLAQEHGYRDACRCADKQEQALRDLVGEEHEEQLEALLEERDLVSHFGGQALFRAGFQIALELTR